VPGSEPPARAHEHALVGFGGLDLVQQRGHGERVLHAGFHALAERDQHRQVHRGPAHARAAALDRAGQALAVGRERGGDQPLAELQPPEALGIGGHGAGERVEPVAGQGEIAAALGERLLGGTLAHRRQGLVEQVHGPREGALADRLGHVGLEACEQLRRGRRGRPGRRGGRGGGGAGARERAGGGAGRARHDGRLQRQRLALEGRQTLGQGAVDGGALVVLDGRAQDLGPGPRPAQTDGRVLLELGSAELGGRVDRAELGRHVGSEVDARRRRGLGPGPTRAGLLVMAQASSGSTSSATRASSC
jgi:hypothetical protein